MKRLICLLLALMMVLGLVACGNNEPVETTAQPTETTVPVVVKDDVLRILMVGNSFCSYYMEELYELLMENPPEGINSVEIYRVYYSGCTLSQHYLWWQQNAAKYDFTRVTANGREKMTEHDA